MGFTFPAVRHHEAVTRVSFTKLSGTSSYSVLQMSLRAGLSLWCNLLNDAASAIARSMASRLSLLWGVWPCSSDVALSTVILWTVQGSISAVTFVNLKSIQKFYVCINEGSSCCLNSTSYSWCSPPWSEPGLLGLVQTAPYSLLTCRWGWGLLCMEGGAVEAGL